MVSLTQDKHKDWKVTVEMPGAMKVLDEMPELHPVRDKMKEVVGDVRSKSFHKFLIGPSFYSSI